MRIVLSILQDIADFVNFVIRPGDTVTAGMNLLLAVCVLIAVVAYLLGSH